MSSASDQLSMEPRRRPALISGGLSAAATELIVSNEAPTGEAAAG
jgi:hypothetical protein